MAKQQKDVRFSDEQKPELRYVPDADAGSVQGLFAHISGVYDFLNTVLSFGLDSLWRKRLATSVQPFPQAGTGRILDLAAGTMEVSLALAKRYPYRSVFALDFCRPMLVRGLPKLTRLRRGIVYPLQGDATRLPLPDNSVDAVTIAFGLRNIRPREPVYAEAIRVLTPGGRFCVLEFGSAQDRIWLGLYNFYLTHILPQAASLVSGNKGAYTYLAKTIAGYPGAETLAGEMRTAGFAGVTFQKYTGGIVCLHIGNKKP